MAGEERGKYKLPMGPQHPMYVEPENLMITADGEKVSNVEVNLGYLHRGIERAMQDRAYQKNVFLAERVCGICSGVHTLTYCSCIEKLAKIEIPKRAKYIRMIVAELERLHSHLMWLGIFGYELGLDTIFMYAWRDREHVMEALEMLSGNRVNYAMNDIGGVRRDVTPAIAKKIVSVAGIVEKRAEYYQDLFSTDSAILARTSGKGILRKGDAKSLCIPGPLARASNLRTDIRKDRPYFAYGSVDWDMVVERGEDVQARALVRIREIIESARILRQCVKAMPEGKLKITAPIKIPKNEAIASGEAPRGELFYYAVSNGTEIPERVRIRTPSFANVGALKTILQDANLADVPMIVSSIDPCFCCTDRVTLIDQNTGKSKVVDENYFRRLGEK